MATSTEMAFIFKRWTSHLIPQSLAPLTASQSKQLDSARGISALIVLLAHCNQILIAPTNNSVSLYAGLLAQAAVIAFFVLSGFFIGRSLLSNHQTNGTLRLLDYLINRAWRLYPPLVLAIALMVMLWLLAPHTFESGSKYYLPGENLARSGFYITLKTTLAPLAFINGLIYDTPAPNGPLWSLAYEAWYYLLGAAFFLMIGKRFLIAAIFVGACIYVSKNHLLLLYLSSVWFAGFFAAIAHSRNFEISRITLYTLAALFIAGALFTGVQSVDKTFFATTLYTPTTALSILIGLFFATTLYMILQNNVRITEKFSGTASFSYSLYILHAPLLYYLFGVIQTTITASTWHALAVSAVAIPMIIGIAFLSSKVFENKKAMLRIGAAVHPKRYLATTPSR